MTTLSMTQRRAFGRTDLDVSPLGFGGAPIGVLDTDTDDVGRVLNTLLDRGVNLIDTAACYYGSEEAIGRAVSGRRDEFVLVTKCGHTVGKDDSRREFSAEVIRESVDRSLKRLRTDRLDVILLHSCDLATLKDGEALATAVEARQAGKVRFVGYSGDNEAAVWACEHPDIAVLQTSISICDQRNIDLVLPVASQHNVGVMAKRPIANAAWRPREDHYEKYSNYVDPYRQRFAEMGLSAGFLREHGLEGDDGAANAVWAEIALRFTLSIKGVHVAIVGTTRPDHVEANLRAAAEGALPDSLVQALRDRFSRADDGSWKGLT